ncbi:MAG: GPW/gp25 family protein [Marinifilaceae bacterium]|jgi:phage baseplate assembly protein W|nr:GPW/gp25 family protein [Marinifilaceae bacterium]
MEDNDKSIRFPLEFKAHTNLTKLWNGMSLGLIDGYDSLQQSIKTILWTIPESRPLYKDFGVGIQDFLFGDLTDKEIRKLKERISYNIDKYEPRIELIDIIEGSESGKNGLIELCIQYKIIETNEESEINIEYNEEMISDIQGEGLGLVLS